MNRLKEKKCCVVIPTHKEKLQDVDEKSLTQALNVFGGGVRDIKLVIPDNISTEYYDNLGKRNDFEIVKVNPLWLSSYVMYNKTLCTSEFYELFNDYEYILIYQTDAWVFYDNLDYFMSLGYDWYGAPWPYLDAINNPVGNGGLSLRKVSKMLEICHEDRNDKGINEDVWFCRDNKDKMKISDVPTASNFSLEVVNEKYLSFISTIPMGWHGKHLLKYRDMNEILKIKNKNNR